MENKKVDQTTTDPHHNFVVAWQTHPPKSKTLKEMIDEIDARKAKEKELSKP